MSLISDRPRRPVSEQVNTTTNADAEQIIAAVKWLLDEGFDEDGYDGNLADTAVRLRKSKTLPLMKSYILGHRTGFAKFTDYCKDNNGDWFRLLLCEDYCRAVRGFMTKNGIGRS